VPSCGLLAGHGDLNFCGVRAGCEELLFAVQCRIRPKVHVFGHIHEGISTASICLHPTFRLCGEERNTLQSHSSTVPASAVGQQQFTTTTAARCSPVHVYKQTRGQCSGQMWPCGTALSS